MDAYQELKKQAIRKRDLAIAAARAEYHDAINAIEKLRATIGENNHAHQPKRFKPLLDAMADAIPKAGRFTFEELLKTMALAEPSRAINSDSVRSMLPKME